MKSIFDQNILDVLARLLHFIPLFNDYLEGYYHPTYHGTYHDPTYALRQAVLDTLNLG